LKASVDVTCSSTCSAWSGCFPCTVTQWKEAGLLNTLFSQGKVDKIENALYIFIYGTGATYSFSQAPNQMCATHDVAETDVNGGYRYRVISLPIIKQETHACNFLRGIGYPNNDYQVDTGAAILFHELVEVVLPKFEDSGSNGVADKCANQVVGIGLAGAKANVNVGGQKYLLPSIWSNTDAACTLLLSSASASTASIWTKVGGTLGLSISVSGNRVCGTNSAHYIFCSTFGQSSWSLRGGLLKQISIDGNRACGVTGSDDVFCTNDIDNAATQWTLISAKLKQIDLQGDYMCGSNSADEIFCAPFMSSSWTQLPGLLKQVSISGKRLCGVTSSSSVFCADDFFNVNWRLLPGSLDQVDVNGDNLCGTASDGSIWCMNINVQSWIRKDGILKKVSMDGTGIRAYGITSAGEIFYASAIN